MDFEVKFTLIGANDQFKIKIKFDKKFIQIFENNESFKIVANFHKILLTQFSKFPKIL